MNFASHRIKAAFTATLATAALLTPLAAQAESILFIGNSFTYAQGSPVHYYRSNTVTDLNNEGVGGVPALFKSFADQAGLHYDVYLETHPGVGLDWHLDNKQGTLGQRPWDKVVMHGFSLLDAAKPGNPALLVSTTRQMTDFLARQNPKVEVRLMSTWARADQVYLQNGAWFGKPLEAMSRDLRSGYDEAAKVSPLIKGVIPVGNAFQRAIQTGIADANPYDGIDAGKVNLWTYDSYHASTFGYYLEALVEFGHITGRDPRSLGSKECSAYELGLSGEQASALEQVAFDQLAAEGLVKAAPLVASDKTRADRCPIWR